ncbi:hypothetical protein BLOT_006841 [Blomia tropicalis]|nr:hypothetical protein BLOT_006841 [Blomia tropicalis]
MNVDASSPARFVDIPWGVNKSPMDWASQVISVSFDLLFLVQVISSFDMFVVVARGHPSNAFSFCFDHLVSTKNKVENVSCLWSVNRPNVSKGGVHEACFIAAHLVVLFGISFLPTPPPPPPPSPTPPHHTTQFGIQANS